MQPGPYPPPTYRPPSAGTAETLILIALILQIIASAVVLLVFSFLSVFAIGFAVSGFALAGIPALIFLVVLVGAVAFLYVGYEYSYRRTKAGDYEGAKGPTLVLGILGLLFGGLITGILYIVAFVKLGDAVNEMQRPMGYYQYGSTPYAYAPTGTPYPYPVAPGPPAPAPPPPSAPGSPVPACPRCGRPATFIPQYHRFYCYTDQMYL